MPRNDSACIKDVKTAEKLALTHEASPACRLLQAMSTVDSPLEQAVFTWILGPRRSKYQLTRFGMTQATVLPVTAVRSVLSGSMAAILA
jgi:hypothetical protein